jgi:hypothetical protein
MKNQEVNLLRIAALIFASGSAVCLFLAEKLDNGSTTDEYNHISNNKDIEHSSSNPGSDQSINSVSVGKNAIFGGVALGLLSAALLSDILGIPSSSFSIQVDDVGSNIPATVFYISSTILASDGLVLFLKKKRNNSFILGILIGFLLLIYAILYTHLEEIGVVSGLAIVGYLMWKYSDTATVIDYDNIRKVSRYTGLFLFIISILITILYLIIFIYANFVSV